MEELETKNTEIKKDNYLARLFKGNVPLVITYWVFGVLFGGILARVGLAALEANYSSLAIKEEGALLIQAFYWLIIAYSAFILISIWRSAGKYEGRSIWGALARGMVILNAISFAANFLLASDSDYALREEIRIMNKSLPTTVDNDTRLDHVSMQQDNIFYNYTLVNLLAVDLDIERFNTIMQPKLKTYACETPDSKSLLEEGRSLIYMYRDKENNPISKVIVSPSDCI